MRTSTLHKILFFILLLFLPIQLGRHFWPNFSYVMGLRIDYLSPTIYLTDILVFLILGIWILEKSKIQNPCLAGRQAKFKITIKNLKFLFFFAGIFIFLLTNCLFAQNQGAAIYKLLKIIEFSLLGFYIAKNHYSLFTIHYLLVLAVIYSSFLAIAQFIKQSSVGGIFWWLGERTFNAGTPGIAKTDFFGHLLLRPYATFPHPNVLAAFVLIAFILSAPFVYRKNKLLFTFYFLLFALMVFLAFSRATWLVGIFIGALPLFRKTFFRKTFAVFTGLILFSFLIFIFSDYLKINEISFLQRLELNKISFQLIKERPLLGVGLNNFIVNSPKFQQGKFLWLQPVHNIYLLVTAETGVVGLLIFLWFLFLTFKKLLYSYTPILLYSYISILLLGFFDHYWLTLQQTQLLFAIVLGLIWGEKKG